MATDDIKNSPVNTLNTLNSLVNTGLKKLYSIGYWLQLHY